MTFSECALLIGIITVILFTVLGMGIIFISLARLGNMFDNISEAQISKRKLNEIKAENEKEQMLINKELSSINKPKYTTELLASILSLIDIEVDYFIMTYEKINKPIELIDLDKKIQKIATNIYEGIKVESYSNELCLYTEEYIMKFIVNAISKKIINASIIYNSNRR